MRFLFAFCEAIALSSIRSEEVPVKPSHAIATIKDDQELSIMSTSSPSLAKSEKQLLKRSFLSGITGLLLCFGVMTAKAPAQNLTDLTQNGGQFWETFHHGTIMANGVRLHYVEGGNGAPLLLVPGWPESWYAWRRVMPALAASGRHVIALDPPGMGDSDHPETGYDLKTVAADIHALVTSMNLTKDGPIDVAGHDVGTWMSYAYASSYPQDIRRLVLFDAALPGVTQLPAGVPTDTNNVKSWHFSFNRLEDLPEILVSGHERAYLAWLFAHKMTKQWALTPADLDEYVRVFEKPGAVRASFAYYRAAFSSEGLAQAHEWAQHKLPMPVLTVGSEDGIGGILNLTLQSVAVNAKGDIAKGCGHFVAEECPETVVKEISDFLH
jgi:pimeloyl-ACP methyl ester carboxylesterase